jgi:hypothetical protein
MIRKRLELQFANEYERAFSVRPAFSVAYLTNAQLETRTNQIADARAARLFGSDR